MNIKQPPLLTECKARRSPSRTRWKPGAGILAVSLCLALNPCQSRSGLATRGCLPCRFRIRSAQSSWDERVISTVKRRPIGSKPNLELSRASSVEPRVREVVGLSHRTVQEVGEAVPCPLRAPVHAKPPVVVVDEGLAHRLEVGRGHVTQDLNRAVLLFGMRKGAGGIRSYLSCFTL